MTRRTVWSFLIVSAIAVAPRARIVAADEFPRELLHWAAFDRNPVFVAARPGHWDARIRERGWILREGDVHHLWYTGYDGTREGQKMLGYATSPDGLCWTRYPGNPLDREHWIEDVMVVKHAGTYHMFAEGRGDRAHLLTSIDRIHWKRIGDLDIRLANGKPIPPGSFGTPFAWHENGVWNLTYERADRGVWLARSTDLLVWTNVSDEPILRPGPAKHESEMIAVNQIIKHKGRYYAMYHGRGKAPEWSTCLAASDDLLRWTKYPKNPLLGDNKSSGIFVNDGKRLRLYTMHDKVQVHFPANEPCQTGLSRRR